MKKSLEALFSEHSTLDKRSAQYIIRALEENNQDGFDYLEYKQSLSGLGKLDMDEAMRYQSAFVTASTMGLTRTRLLETAHFYKKIVAREKDKFDTTVQHQMKKKLASKQEEGKRYEQIINENYDKIQKLKEQIAAYQTKIEKIQEELNGAEGKINAAKESFEKAYQIILGQIDNDIQKIESYIKS